MISKLFTRSESEKLNINNKKLSVKELSEKLLEETNEVISAIEKEDKNNLVEEILDNIQVSINLLEKLDFNSDELEEFINKHNLKLDNRDWKRSKEIIIITKKF